MTNERDYFGEVVTIKTVRDHFAMAALTGLLSRDVFDSGYEYGPNNAKDRENLALAAYQIADAMLAERNKTRSETNIQDSGTAEEPYKGEVEIWKQD